MAPPAPSGQQHPGPRSSPTVADGKVITLGVRGTLSCLDAATGKVLWRKSDIEGTPRFFTAMSPLVVNGLCIAQLGGSANGVAVAYDLSTGAEKWKWAGDGPAYGSPVRHVGRRQQVDRHANQKRIVALNVADGKLVWEAPSRPRA